MIMFVLGFMTMAVFSFFSILFLDNERETLGMLFSGPVTWVVVLICSVDRKVRQYFKFYNVRSLLICPDGSIKYIEHKKVDVMRSCADRKYTFPDFTKHKEWDIKDWRKEFVVMGCGSMRYAPKKVWSQYPTITKEEYKYAKEHQIDKEW